MSDAEILATLAECRRITPGGVVDRRGRVDPWDRILATVDEHPVTPGTLEVVAELAAGYASLLAVVAELAARATA